VARQQTARPRAIRVRTAEPVMPAGKRGAARPFIVGFAFLAAAGFFLVNIVDPYSGAAASPGFASSHQRFHGQQVQSLSVSSTSMVGELTADSYASKAAPPPPPPPAPARAVSSDDAADSPSAPSAGNPDPDSAQAYAQGALAAQGMGSDQFNCLVALWNRESGWNVHASNPGSGAYGIPQALPGNKMATAGPDWQDSYVTQVDWGLGYVMGRYGSPCGAWAHSESTGWY
jgi:hypothetical protein